MTEAEWNACADPFAMLAHLAGKSPTWKHLDGNVSSRKLRLFACACARRFWNILTNPRSREAVEVAERFADDKADANQLLVAEREADPGSEFTGHYHYVLRSACLTASSRLSSLLTASGDAANAAGYRAMCEAVSTGGRRILGNPKHAELAAQAASMRCIFGNPFRPVSLDPAWLPWHDGAVRKMSQVIYDERRFADLPILADALEDAGCADAAILAHCREPDEHVRGCWVVDLLLGKA